MTLSRRGALAALSGAVLVTGRSGAAQEVAGPDPRALTAAILNASAAMTHEKAQDTL